jgi:hypothetical protein
MHASYFCHTSPKTFLFTPLAVHTRHFGCITITDLDRPTPVCCCCSLQTCTVVYVISSRGWIKNLYMKFPYSAKERIICHIINFDAKTFLFGRARRVCPLWSGWCWGLLTWPTLKNFIIRGSWRKQTAGHLAPGYWVVQLQVLHLWLIIKTSFVLRAAVARGLCFKTLAVPNQIRYPVWGQELVFLHALNAECLLRKSGLLLCIWNRWSLSEMPYI